MSTLSDIDRRLEEPETGPPPGWLYLTEPARGALQLQTLALALPWLATAPRGDGHPVVVLPGLLTTDMSTRPLRAFLRALGYRPHGWGLGRNLGPTQRTVEHMRRKLRELADSTGAAVSLVGWSLGGIYARELSRESPSLVRRVVTLGSPFGLIEPGDDDPVGNGRRLVGHHAPGLPDPEEAARPVPVPSSALYSRRDGIVGWRHCMGRPSTLHENIEVRCAHLGFGHDPATLWAVADRLAQPAGSHAPFRRPGWFRWLYPAGR